MLDHVKTRPILIMYITLFLLQIEQTFASELKNIRVANHKDFIRFVFDFQGPVLYEEPITSDKGKIYLAFLDTTNKTPGQNWYKKADLVDNIEFLQKKSHLFVRISHSIPYFEIKYFSLLKPERFILDIYPQETQLKSTLFQRTITQKNKTSQRKKEKIVPTGNQHKSLSHTKPSSSKTTHLNLYYLLILIAILVIIILLTLILLYKKRSMSRPMFPDGMLDEIRKAKKTIEELNSMIHNEFKKYESLQ